MCDTSSSMAWKDNSNVLPLHSAIGLAEIATQLTNTPFKNKLLTFSTSPEWITLPETIYNIPGIGDKNIQDITKEEWNTPGIEAVSGNFEERINHIVKSPWGRSTDFYKALDLILNSCIESNMSPEEVGELTLFVFSDMQFDQSLKLSYSWSHEYTMIKAKFTEAGQKSSYGRPFVVPFIIFWNLKGNSLSNPVKGNQEGTAYISGFSQSAFNSFLDGTLLNNNISRPTPDIIVRNILDNDRYKPIKNICQEFI